MGVTDRAVRGKAARARSPRGGNAHFERPGVDPLAILAAQEADRIAELVPIRYGRMLASPFAFFRGAAAIMAADLAASPTSGLVAQACGDAHLSNFGVYRSPDRRMVFDLNDFDETLPGPWEWDVKRLVTSLVVAGRENGFSPQERTKIARSATAAYRFAMRDFAGRPNLAVWYARVDMGEWLAQTHLPLTSRQRSSTAALVAKAGTRDSLRASRKLTRLVDGHRRLVSIPPLLVPVEELTPDRGEDEILADLQVLLRGYDRTLQSDRRALLGQFEVVHMARKVVGVGSVGTRAWVVLLVGRDDGDLLLLQAKEAQPSVLAAHVGPARFANEGQRVVAGQLLMQATSDIFLGSKRVMGPDGPRDFYVRQLHDGKGSVAVERMAPSGMLAYGRLCAWTLARAHARSGDRVAMAGYLGSSDRFDRAIAEFAEAYADQNANDHRALAGAVQEGLISAVVGV